MQAENRYDLEQKLQKLIAISRRAAEWTGSQTSTRIDQAILYAELYAVTKDRNDLGGAREAAKRVQNMEERAAVYAQVYAITKDRADLAQAWRTTEKIKSLPHRASARVRIYHVTRDLEDLALARIAIEEMVAQIETVKQQCRSGEYALARIVYNCTGLYRMTAEERFLEIARDIAQYGNRLDEWGMWRRIWEVSHDESDRETMNNCYYSGPYDLRPTPMHYKYLD